MALLGTQYTVTATAFQPLKALYGHVPLQQIDFFADSGNTGTVYLGNSSVTATPTNALVAIPKGTGYTSGPYDNGPEYVDDYYVVGTANDKLYIKVVTR